jgi:hypothetical protein
LRRSDGCDLVWEQAKVLLEEAREEVRFMVLAADIALYCYSPYGHTSAGHSTGDLDHIMRLDSEGRRFTLR